MMLSLLLQMQRSIFQRVCYKGFVEVATILLEGGACIDTKDDVSGICCLDIRSVYDRSLVFLTDGCHGHA
jgi:hypothetical protein